MEKTWLKQYSSGVPGEINPDKYKSIIDLFEQSCKKFENNVALESMGVPLTFKNFDRLAHNFAAYIQTNTDLKPGDRIALQMPNILSYPIAIYGSLLAGLVVVNTNPLYTPREMEHQFKDSGAKAIVLFSPFAPVLKSMVDKTDIKTVIIAEATDLFPTPDSPMPYEGGLSFRAIVADNPANKFTPVAVKNSDIAFLQYTGGTTGVSKGAILTHRNVLANVEQSSANFAVRVIEGKEIIVTPLPLYHIFSLTVNFIGYIANGGKNILVANPRDIPGFVKILSTSKLTFLTGVNTLFNTLCHDEEFKKLDFSTLKSVIGGATSIQKPVADLWKKVTGTALVEGYGLTETSPVVTCNKIDGTERVGTIGIPLPSTDIKLMDEDGNEVPQGEPGEIWVKGPQVMQGYYNKPEETAKVLTADGWLKTGDIAIVSEDGYFKIVDRKKDMIIVSGFNVYPNEVEEVVAMHPKVMEAACIGIEDERSGEIVKIFVVKKDPSLTEAELLEHCKQNLTGYKVPKAIEFRDDLPKTPIGKILRRMLRPDAVAKA
jgi:long-chain acyl-CoA synthetase